MKKFSWHSRIAVALLLVVMMVFSVVSVTAFAATENVNGAGDEVTKTSYDEPWYTITYIPPQNGEEAKLDVQIKTAYSKYLEITKQDAIDLVKQIISVATQYAMDSVLGTNSGETASADYGFALVASVGSVDIPDGLKGVLKNFLEEQFGTSDFSSVEELKEHVQANPEVKENLKEKVESVTKGEFDVVIQVAVDQYVGNNATEEELDELNEKIQNIVDEVLPDVIEVVYDEDGDGVLSEEEKVVVEEVKQKVTETVTANVNKVVEVKKEGGSIYSNLSVTDIVKSFKTVTIDDQVVLSRVNGLTIDYNAIVDALKKIPMPGEMAEYSVEDFKSLLAYDLGVEFAFGSFGIDVSFGLTGTEAELSKVKAVMALVSSHVDIDVTKDGEFALKLLIPDEFAALVLRAANSGMIPDSIKHKVFTLLDKNGNDIVAFINEDLTLDEIITLLQSIDYEKVIDKALGKDIILKLAKKAGIDDNLDNLTNEQIDAKLDALAEKLGVYYNKAIKLVVRATDYIPEKFMDKTLSDFYVGEGVFHATEDVTVNEELIIKAFDKFEAVVTKERIAKLLDKAGSVFNQDEVDTILAKLGTDLTKEELASIYDSVVAKIDGYVLANYDKALEYIKPVILAAWGNREVTLNLDVTVEFLDIYQVQFVDGDNVVKGFLPVGADINFFANNANVNAWIGVDDGEIYTTMPNKDVVLQPAGQFTTWVEYNGEAVTNVEGVYTKDGYTLVANVEYARDAVITYQWYNDNGAIEGATNALYTIVNVLDSGNYWCEVTVVDAEASVNKTVATEKVNVAIEKAVYDNFASVTLNKNEVIYNAANQTVAIVLPVGFPEEIEVQYDETLLTKKDAGTYDVVVTFVSDNYVVPSTSTVLTWKIAAKSINLKDYGVKWQNTVTFGYDKTEHTVVLTGLDSFTLFDIVAKYTANKATDAGTYTAEVSFEYNNNNYVVEAFETCAWKVEKKVINLGDITLTWVINGGAVNWKTNSAYPYTVEYTGTEYVVTYVVDYNGKDYADYIEITVTYGTDANKDNKGTDVGAYSTDFTIAQTLKVAEKNVEFTGSLVFGVNPFEWEIVSAPSTECEHVDADDNGKCDKCGVDFEDGVDIIVPPCTHRDANDDGKCDKCGVDFTDGKDIPDDDIPENPEDKVVELIPGVTVTIPDGATANLSATDVTENYIKNKIKEGLEKGYVGKVIVAYDITGDFVDGIKVTFNIPADYVTHPNLAIYYIDAEGNATLVNSAVVGDKIVFEPEHFSVYALVAIEEQSNWWIWLVVALAVVVVVAVIVIIIVVKRRKKKDDDEGDEDDTDAPAPTAPVTVVSAPVVVVTAPGADAKAAENMVQVTNADPKVVYASPDAKGTSVNTTPFVGEATVKFPGLSSAKVASPVNSEGFAEKKNTLKNPENDYDENAVYVDYRSSFTSRLIQANSVLQEYYTKIKNHILSYNDVKQAIGWNYEVFTKGRYQCIKLNVKSKSITLNLALEPKKFETKDHHVIDLSDNPKFEKLPMLFKVKDEATLGYALTLISEVMNKLGVQQGEIPNVDYRMPYESNTELLKRGLVKGIKATDADVRAASDNDGASREELFLYDHEHAAHVEIHDEDSPVNNIEDAVTEKASSSESTPEISSEDTVMVGGNVVLIRYRSSFMSRFIQAEKDVQDYYTAIKNHINSYNGIKSRTSWNYETFSSGRNQCVRLNIKGRTLMVCLALDPKVYNINKYHFVDMSDDPKFDKVPMLLKIRSDRALKYALELIDELMKTLGISKGENQNVDYHKPYESNSSLAKRGLMKIILPAGVNINESTILKEENVDEMMDAHKQGDDKESKNIAGEFITEEKKEEIAADEALSDAIDENEVSKEDDVEMDASIINSTSEEEDEAEEVLDDIHVFTDAQHADEMIDDYEAEHSIEIIKKARTGKIEEVNIDEICANFDDGAVVTIESLKAKKLISKSAGRVKVLAKGTMTKCLTVEADRFSLQAVKMITLAGGVAKRYN